MTAENLDLTDLHERAEVDELAERRRLEQESRAAEASAEPPADGDAGDDQDQTADQPAEAETQQLDVFQLAELVLVGANNRLAQSKTPPSLEKQLALGHALATLELARWTRAAYRLNEQMARLAVNDRNAAVAKAAGPGGIVLPSMVPGRG